MINKYCVIIGTKKAATSSIYEYLAQHPQICPGFTKEPKFFTNNENWRKGLRFYESLFKYKKGVHEYALDASTDYTQPGFPVAANRMITIDARFKLIYILRDPLSKIESLQRQFYIDGDTKYKLKDAIDWRIIESAKYAKMLDKYTEIFSIEDILLIDFDDIKHDTAAVMRRIVEFLGIDKEYTFDISRVHNEKDSALGQSLKSYRAIRSLLRRMKVTQFLTQTIKDKIRSFIGNYVSPKVDESDFKLNNGQIEVVVREVAEDVKLLKDKYNFEFKNRNIYKHIKKVR